jgi:hypothetical protein
MSAKTSLARTMATPRSSHTYQHLRPGRANTRQFTPPANVPIPPSLLHSPYLHSPQSIFRRSAASFRYPSQEDDEWLRDTVPLPSGERTGTGSSPRSWMQGGPKQEAVSLENNDIQTDSRSVGARNVPPDFQPADVGIEKPRDYSYGRSMPTPSR